MYSDPCDGVKISTLFLVKNTKIEAKQGVC